MCWVTIRNGSEASPGLALGMTEVNDFTVLSDTLAVAELSVSTETSPGWRNVVMDNGGGDRVTLYDGFKVDRVALAASFEPTLAEQGDTVEFTIQARDTDFTAGIPSLTFFDRFGENPDIIVDTVTILMPKICTVK